MVEVETVTGVYAKLENRPGTLERVGRALGDRRLQIDAISAETLGSTGVVRIITTDARRAVEALRGAGIEAYESQLVVANLANRPGELGRAARELAAAQINVEGVVTTADGRLAFRTSDLDRTEQILRKI